MLRKTLNKKAATIWMSRITTWQIITKTTKTNIQKSKNSQLINCLNFTISIILLWKKLKKISNSSRRISNQKGYDLGVKTQIYRKNNAY